MKTTGFSPRLPFAGFVGLARRHIRLGADLSLPAAQVGQSYSFQVTTTPAAPAGTNYAATVPSGFDQRVLRPDRHADHGGRFGLDFFTSSGATNSFAYTSSSIPPPARLPSRAPPPPPERSEAPFSYTVSDNRRRAQRWRTPAGLGGTTSAHDRPGTPTTAGTYQVSLSANNGIGHRRTTTLTITVNPPAPCPRSEARLRPARRAPRFPKPSRRAIRPCRSPRSDCRWACR